MLATKAAAPVALPLFFRTGKWMVIAMWDAGQHHFFVRVVCWEMTTVSAVAPARGRRVAKGVAS